MPVTRLTASVDTNLDCLSGSGQRKFLLRHTGHLGNGGRVSLGYRGNEAHAAGERRGLDFDWQRLGAAHWRHGRRA